MAELFDNLDISPEEEAIIEDQYGFSPTEQRIMRLLGKIPPDIDDELQANIHYLELAELARTAGLLQTADSYIGMAIDEARHAEILTELSDFLELHLKGTPDG